MIRKWLNIELRSDLCAGSGAGINGVIDMDIVHEWGVPILPAKRLKGALRNVAMELENCGCITKSQRDGLFGCAGEASSSSLHLYDAHLYQDMKKISYKDYEAFIKEIKEQNVLQTQDVLDYFTSIRTRTALDEESGSAKNGSLRSMRVVHKGCIFRGKIEIEEEGMEQVVSTLRILEECIKGLRHLGMNITRGFGEVRCYLEDYLEKEEEVQVDNILGDPSEMIQVDYTLFLKTPLLLNSANALHYTSENWIPGGMLLGAFAGMFIKDNKLGKEAHKDPTFARIFLNQGVSFGYAYPKVKDDIYIPCPQHIGRIKNEATFVNQLSLNEKMKEMDKQVRKENRLVAFKNGKISVHDPIKVVKMHHARGEDRSIAYANKDAPKMDNTGEFFQYIALKEGQQFSGTLRGKKEDLQQLMNCVAKHNGKLRLGRSRTAEYGDVEMKISNRQKPTENKANKIILWIQSPIILRDELGNFTCDPRYLMDQIRQVLSCEVEVLEQYMSYTQVAGYNSKWRLPKVQIEALAQGSVLCIETDGKVDCTLLSEKRWGEVTGEGNGMIRFMPSDEFQDEYPLEAELCEEVNGSIKHDTLQRIKAKLDAERLAQVEVMKALKIKMPSLNATAIEQLISMFRKPEMKNYEALCKEIYMVSNKQKQNEMLEFIKCCEDKNRDFIEAYLTYAKWEKRKEELTHERG